MAGTVLFLVDSQWGPLVNFTMVETRGTVGGPIGNDPKYSNWLSDTVIGYIHKHPPENANEILALIALKIVELDGTGRITPELGHFLIERCGVIAARYREQSGTELPVEKALAELSRKTWIPGGLRKIGGQLLENAKKALSSPVVTAAIGFVSGGLAGGALTGGTDEGGGEVGFDIKALSKDVLAYAEDKAQTALGDLGKSAVNYVTGQIGAVSKNTLQQAADTATAAAEQSFWRRNSWWVITFGAVLLLLLGMAAFRPR